MKISSVHMPAELKNLAINGALDFWQRVEGNTTTINDASVHLPYLADMVQVQSNGTTTKNYSVVRSTNVPTFSQSGFQSTYSWLFTMITGISSPAATDYVSPFCYRMEGLDYAKIHSKTVTFGFWVYASVAGTYNFALNNAAANRSYVTTFTVNGSNTWQFVPITVTMDSTGTWQFDNTFSLGVYIGVIGGSTYQTSTLAAWQSGQVYASSAATNWQATSGAVLQIAQFSIVEGPIGFSATGFNRAGKSIQQELAMCQRYFEKSYDIGTAVGTANGSGNFGVVRASDTTGNYNGTNPVYIKFAVNKRVIPANVSYYSTVTGAVGNVRVNGTTDSSAPLGLSTDQGGFTISNTTSGPLGTTPTVGNYFLFQWAMESGL